jgi:protein TonB
MQGQIASPKSSTLGPPIGNAGNAGTADADYKSDGLKNAQPNYPLYARKMNQEGVVILSVEVLTDGSAGDVRVATSSGIRLLDKAAMEAVKAWNFKPAKKDGVLYVQRLRVPIIFSLSSK